MIVTTLWFAATWQLYSASSQENHAPQHQRSLQPQRHGISNPGVNVFVVIVHCKHRHCCNNQLVLDDTRVLLLLWAGLLMLLWVFQPYNTPAPGRVRDRRSSGSNKFE
ncbi:uncharacterized protein LOC142777331 [Rhipicephalus microplus]|uniref:uncharacterized protein LOC142777331 n=1 Tax=Rhipicephalus microplus TaxID=6941 RepID=UPI003F6D6678